MLGSLLGGTRPDEASSERQRSSVGVPRLHSRERVEICLHEVATLPKYPLDAEWVEGAMFITSCRMVFLAEEGAPPVFDIPLLAISAVDKVNKGRHGSPHRCKLVFTIKDIRVVTCSFPREDGTRGRVYDHIIGAIMWQSSMWAERIFCVAHRDKESTEVQPGWDVYDPEAEYRRLGILDNGWKLTNINSDFGICSSYPQVLCVPATVDDRTLANSAGFRAKGRFPLISYYHKPNGTTLSRSSQPESGPLFTRDKDDEYLVSAITGSRAVIFDLRPHKNAQANRFVNGGGFEHESNYSANVRFCSIENIHYVRQVFEKLSSLILDNPQSWPWLAAVEDTGWLQTIRGLLETAKQCTDTLVSGTSVLLHCSDGWDRTAQIVGISQVIIDPHCRTLRGFAKLVEREWVKAGHNFRRRLGYGLQEQSESSPIFLQFLDAVHQLQEQNPTAFEFNSALLIFLADASQSGMYGTFAINSWKEALDNNIPTSTPSVWGAVLQPPTSRFLNPIYAEDRNVGMLTVDCRPMAMRFWRSYFLRYAGGRAASPPLDVSLLQQVGNSDWEKAALELARALVQAQRDVRTIRDRYWDEYLARGEGDEGSPNKDEDGPSRSYSQMLRSSAVNLSPLAAYLCTAEEEEDPATPQTPRVPDDRLMARMKAEYNKEIRDLKRRNKQLKANTDRLEAEVGLLQKQLQSYRTARGGAADEEDEEHLRQQKLQKQQQQQQRGNGCAPVPQSERYRQKLQEIARGSLTRNYSSDATDSESSGNSDSSTPFNQLDSLFWEGSGAGKGFLRARGGEGAAEGAPALRPSSSHDFFSPPTSS